jgi:hypothetical protein
LEIVERKVKPERDVQNRDALRERWWQYAEKRPGLVAAVAQVSRVLLTNAQAAQHHTLAFYSGTAVFANSLNVFPIPTWQAFALLQSYVHELWARYFSSSLEDRLRYNPTDCFETFPFPAGWETDATLEAAGREYYEARAALMVSHHEGLTKTYNRFHDPAEDAPGIHRLRRLHAALDHAVLAAYGWSDLLEPHPTPAAEGSTPPVTNHQSPVTCQFLPDYYDEPEQEGGAPIPKSIRHRWPDATRDEVLARLLKLNAERAAEEAAEKKREDANEPRKKSAAKKPAQKKTGGAAPAQGELVPPPQTDMFAT